MNDKKSIIDKIDEFTKLPYGWDGRNSFPVLESIANKTKKFIVALSNNLISKIHDLYPNSNGTITFEWINSNGEELFFEVGENNYSYFMTYNNNPPKLVDGNDVIEDFKSIEKDLSEFIADERYK